MSEVRNNQYRITNNKGEIMFHLSRAIVFVVCLAAAVFVAWWVGPLGLFAGLFFVPRQTVVHKTQVTK